MAKAHGIVESPLDAQTTFDKVADFSTTEKWDPGVVEAEKLTDGTPDIGSRFRVVAKFMGRESELVYEISEFTPGQRVVLRGENRNVISIDEITVEPTQSGSRLTYSAELQLKGPLKLADPLLGIAFAGVARKALEGLTSYLSV